MFLNSETVPIGAPLGTVYPTVQPLVECAQLPPVSLGPVRRARGEGRGRAGVRRRARVRACAHARPPRRNGPRVCEPVPAAGLCARQGRVDQGDSSEPSGAAALALARPRQHCVQPPGGLRRRVCACVRVCVRACARARAHVRACVRACVLVSVCGACGRSCGPRAWRAKAAGWRRL